MREHCTRLPRHARLSEPSLSALRPPRSLRAVSASHHEQPTRRADPHRPHPPKSMRSNTPALVPNPPLPMRRHTWFPTLARPSPNPLAKKLTSARLLLVRRRLNVQPCTRRVKLLAYGPPSSTSCRETDVTKLEGSSSQAPTSRMMRVRTLASLATGPSLVNTKASFAPTRKLEASCCPWIRRSGC